MAQSEEIARSVCFIPSWNLLGTHASFRDLRTLIGFRQRQPIRNLREGKGVKNHLGALKLLNHAPKKSAVVRAELGKNKESQGHQPIAQHANSHFMPRQTASY